MLCKDIDTEALKDVVRDQIQVIDAQITMAHKQGMDGIVYDLPVNFELSHMPLEDAQLYVYSELVAIYKAKPPHGKGFSSVKLSFGDSTTKIIIGWTVGLTQRERACRKAIIRGYTQQDRPTGRKARP